MPNSAQVVPRGRAYLETAVVNLRSNDHATRLTLVPALLRLGVAEDLELRAFWNVVAHESAPPGDETWTGPFTLGFKYRLNPGDAGFLHPSFGVEGLLVLPLATGGRTRASWSRRCPSRWTTS